MPTIPPIKVTFTDTDFFRRLVAERASTFPSIEFMSDFREYVTDLLAQTYWPNISQAKDGVAFNVRSTEVLVKIAALCERAAVDLTIPASRTSQEGRARRPRRAASKPAATKKGKA